MLRFASGHFRFWKDVRYYTHLQNMPVDDWPPWVLDHLLPVLEFQALPVVAKQNLPDGVRWPDPVIVSHYQLQVDALESANTIYKKYILTSISCSFHSSFDKRKQTSLNWAWPQRDNFVMKGSATICPVSHVIQLGCILLESLWRMWVSQQTSRYHKALRGALHGTTFAANFGTGRQSGNLRSEDSSPLPGYTEIAANFYTRSCLLNELGPSLTLVLR